MSHIKGHSRQANGDSNGRLVWRTGHISAASARNWHSKLTRESGQPIILKEVNHGDLEIRTTGDPAFVLYAIHVHIEDHNELFLRQNARYGVTNPPRPPALENPNLLRRLKKCREKFAMA